MGEVSWLVDKRILLVVNSGQQTRKKLQQSIKDVNALIAIGKKPVHVISDNRAVTTAPISISIMKDIFTGTKMPQAGHVVLVCERRIIEFTSRLAAYFGGSQTQNCTKTIEQAIKMLQEYDVTLPKNIAFNEDNVLSRITARQ